VTAIGAAAEDPTLVIDPPSFTMPPATSQVFTATFSDGSHIKQCVWATTGNPPNSMVSLGTNNAVGVMGAGTTPGQFVVTAVCSNTHGVTAVGSVAVTIQQQ